MVLRAQCPKSWSGTQDLVPESHGLVDSLLGEAPPPMLSPPFLLVGLPVCWHYTCCQPGPCGLCFCQLLGWQVEYGLKNRLPMWKGHFFLLLLLLLYLAVLRD